MTALAGALRGRIHLPRREVKSGAEKMYQPAYQSLVRGSFPPVAPLVATGPGELSASSVSARLAPNGRS